MPSKGTRPVSTSYTTIAKLRVGSAAAAAGWQHYSELRCFLAQPALAVRCDHTVRHARLCAPWVKQCSIAPVHV